MGIIAFDVSKTWDFTLPEDTGDPKTVFHLGHLDSALATFLADSVINYELSEKGRDFTINNNQRDRELVRFAVKGWENLNRDDGAPVVPVFSDKIVGGTVGTRRGLSDGALDFLIPYYFALAREIQKGNSLTATEIKNSPSPSS